MEEALIQSLLESANNGLRAQSGFKEGAWKDAVSAVIKHTSPGKQHLISIDRCKTKVDTFKFDWREWTALLGLSGWSIDESTGCPIADKKVIKVYFEAHPKAKKFALTPLHHQSEFNQLFGDIVASGEHAVGPEGLGIATSIENSSSEVELRRKATSNMARANKKRKIGGSERMSDTLEKVAAVIDQSNQISLEESPIQQATDMLYSGFEDVPIHHKVRFALQLVNQGFAEIFLHSPKEAQLLMIQQVDISSN